MIRKARNRKKLISKKKKKKKKKKKTEETSILHTRKTKIKEGNEVIIY